MAARERATGDAHGVWRPAASHRVWQVLALVLAVYVVQQDVEGLLAQARLLPGVGQYGGAFAKAPEFGAGYVKLADVAPGGPLARAGLVDGDHVRFAPAYDYLRHPLAGDEAHLTLRRGANERPVVIRAEPGPPLRTADQINFQDIATILSCLAPALFGAFIIWRSRSRATPLLLGSVLITYGLAHFVPQALPGGRALFLPFYMLGVANFYSIAVLFAAFAVQFVQETSGQARRVAWLWLAGFAAVYAMGVAGYGHALGTVSLLPLVGNAATLTTLLSTVGFGAAFVYLAYGWSHAPRDTQRRYALMLVASAAIVLAQLGYVVLAAGLGGASDTVLRSALEVLSGVLAPALFAYAILRQRVFDLGFAINRTLVYGVVSAIVLTAFGLLEWAFHHFIPIEARATNAFFDAAIALGVYLGFHRVRDAVEHGVERLFFRTWRERDAALRRFVHDAGHIQRAPALTRAFLAALERFSGAAAAIYLADHRGDYLRAGGESGLAPKRIDTDAPTVVTLRAEAAPVDLEHMEPSARPPWRAALALPMLNRSRLSGFVLLGPKTVGVGYRPDELEVLSHAAHQVALDLHWIETEAMQRRLAAMLATT